MKLSVITVTFNAETFLKSCIESLQRQTHPEIEYIVIDGLSIDDTLNIVGSYACVSLFVSEKDKGMYDALNKGIKQATGDVIGILNADDFLASEDILAKVANIFASTNAQIVYGDLWYVDKIDTNKVLRRWKSKPYKPGMFQWGWMPAHPTFYARRELFEHYGNYRLDMGSAADYELMIRFLHKYKLKSVYLPEVMVKMRTGGMSNSTINARLKANAADMEAMKINGIKYPRLAALLKPLRKIPQFLGM